MRLEESSRISGTEFQFRWNQTDQNALEHRVEVTLNLHLTREIVCLSFILSHIKYLNTTIVPLDVANHNAAIKDIRDDRREFCRLSLWLHGGSRFAWEEAAAIQKLKKRFKCSQESPFLVPISSLKKNKKKTRDTSQRDCSQEKQSHATAV